MIGGLSKASAGRAMPVAPSPRPLKNNRLVTMVSPSSLRSRNRARWFCAETEQFGWVPAEVVAAAAETPDRQHFAGFF
jgi:hypothetical protein